MIRNVQALRTLACALVVAFHAHESWPNGAAGVDIFFVISGFVMAHVGAGLSGPADAWRFVVRRGRRLVPLYWLMTGAKLAVLAVSGAALDSAWHVAASLLFIPARDGHGAVRPVLGVGWTLQFECLFYGLFAVAVARRQPAWRVLLPALVPLAIAGFFRRPDWPAPCVLANGLVLEFCLGVAVAWLCALVRPATPLSAGVFALGLVLLLTLPPPGPWRFLAWGVPAAMMLAGALWLEPVCGARVPAWLLAAGDASYATYLVHPFVVPALAAWVLLHAPALAAPPLLIGMSVVVSALAGLLLHRRVDRPIQRWLSARRDGPAGLRAPMTQLVQP